MPLGAAGEVRGAAMRPDGILTWGESLAIWPFNGAAPRLIETGRQYGAAGCLHGESLFLLEGHRLIRHRPRLVIEEDTRTSDLLWVELQGRTGLLYVHLDAQLRLWTPQGVEEVYSIYTPSRQSGLTVADIDQDGAADVLCGNYWLKPSGQRGAAWRLYAINTYFERGDSALARILFMEEPRGLLWASAERLAWLTPPPDIRQLWPATAIEAARIGRPACWLNGPLTLLGHSQGVHAFRWTGTRWNAQRYMSGFSCVALLERNDQIWAVTPEGPRIIYPLR